MLISQLIDLKKILTSSFITSVCKFSKTIKTFINLTLDNAVLQENLKKKEIELSDFLK